MLQLPCSPSFGFRGLGFRVPQKTHAALRPEALGAVVRREERNTRVGGSGFGDDLVQVRVDDAGLRKKTLHMSP